MDHPEGCWITNFNLLTLLYPWIDSNLIFLSQVTEEFINWFIYFQLLLSLRPLMGHRGKWGDTWAFSWGFVNKIKPWFVWGELAWAHTELWSWIWGGRTLNPTQGFLPPAQGAEMDNPRIQGSPSSTGSSIPALPTLTGQDSFSISHPALSSGPLNPFPFSLGNSSHFPSWLLSGDPNPGVS